VRASENISDIASYRAPGDGHTQRVCLEYSYDVIFTRNAFDPANGALVNVLAGAGARRPSRAAVFVDAEVLRAIPDLAGRIAAYFSAHGAAIELAGAIVAVPGGEAAKNDPAVLERLLVALKERRIDRHAYSIAVGGGAVLDAVGFAAAIFHRGVRHVRMPTTVLAQDDGGVGVKCAVNALGIKNLVGAFAPPTAVINDGAFLDALPPAVKRDGMAEAVKVALIRDGAFFAWLEANAAALAGGEPGALDRMIRRCAELHMRQIAHGGDPFERGSARPLDYGHWSAHRLEAMTGNALSHGAAVAIGIALDTRYSVTAGLLAAGVDERVAALLERLGFALWHAALAERAADGRLAVLGGLEEFREHLGGELTVTLLEAVGAGVEVHAIDDAGVVAAIDWLAARRGAARS